MLGFRKPPRREFNYTPFYLKEPEKDLKERLRIPREDDYFRKRRSSLSWVILLVLFLGLFEFLFPGIVRQWFQPDVTIEMHESIERLRPEQGEARKDRP
jgi:hypothetical protein